MGLFRIWGGIMFRFLGGDLLGNILAMLPTHVSQSDGEVFFWLMIILLL